MCRDRVFRGCKGGWRVYNKGLAGFRAAAVGRPGCRSVVCFFALVSFFVRETIRYGSRDTGGILVV